MEPGSAGIGALSLKYFHCSTLGMIDMPPEPDHAIDIAQPDLPPTELRWARSLEGSLAIAHVFVAKDDTAESIAHAIGKQGTEGEIKHILYHLNAFVLARYFGESMVGHFKHFTWTDRAVELLSRIRLVLLKYAGLIRGYLDALP